jgi:hypothetical protein
MKYIQELWGHAAPYLGLGGLGLGAALSAAYLFGLLPIIGAVVQFISAVVSPIVSAIISGVIWVWQTILWPGLMNIFTTFVTAATVAAIVGAVFLYTKVNDDIKYNNLQNNYNQCVVDLKKTGRISRPVVQQPLKSVPKFKFPWE